MKIQNREQSIIGIWPEVEKYWNYKYNNGIKPENVRPNQKIFLVTTCPYCGKNVEFIPLLSFKRFGKYSFTPHICNALNEYCASLLEQRCTKGKISLSMDNLDDRRLKDWLIRTAKHRENINTIKNIDKLKKLEKKIGFKITCINLYRMDIANLDDLSWC